MSGQSAERDRIVRVLLRHRFCTPDGGATGFCGGPYCALGLMSAQEHAEHIADMLPSSPPGEGGSG